jgi:NADH:ubiquinone oxidoreductase subunit 6 (subunit J)
MAKSKIAEEKEYQDAVKYTSSIVGDLKRAIEDTAEASDLRNKKIFEEISLTKKVLSSLKDEKSYEEALIKLSTQKGQVLQSNYGVNEKMKSTYLAQLDAADAIVKKELARLKIINETQRIADNLQNKFVSSLDSIGEKIKGIPIIGETLFNRFWTPFSDKAKGSIDAVKKRFMTQFKTGFTQATNKGNNMMESFTSGLSRGFGSAKNMIMGLLGPQGIAILSIVAVVAAVALIAYAIYKAFKVGLERFKELDAAAKAFREETGLLNSQTKSLQNNICVVLSSSLFE